MLIFILKALMDRQEPLTDRRRQNKIASRFFFGVIFFDVWEAATAVTKKMINKLTKT